MKFSSLKILADENISPRIVAFLRQQGINVIDVKEKLWHGKDDEYILKKGYLEKCFVLTHDSDFGTLVVNEGKEYYGIIYLRLKNLKPQNVINIIKKLLPLDMEFHSGTIVVVEDARIRIRQSAKKE